jgi:hypothetical protein
MRLKTWYINAIPAHLGRGQASPLQRQRFLVLGDRISGAFWRSRCRLAPTLFTKKARRSVTYLTFADTFWRAVLTFLVLLRTEAGGMPAFQSVAAFIANVNLTQNQNFLLKIKIFRNAT